MPKKKSKIKWFILVNIIILFFLIIAFGKEYVGNLQIEREIAQLQGQRDSLENDQLDTLNLISELSSEYYLEQEGRVKQGLGREGETLVIIQDKDDQESNNEDLGILSGFTLDGINNPTRWFYYFFAKDKFDELKNL